MILAAVAGLLATLIAAGPVRSAMRAAGVVDNPNHRSSHQVPTPRGGGLACLAGVWAAAGVAQLAGHAVPWGLVVGASALGLVGFADDKASISAPVRLVAQLAIGPLIGAFAGGGWLILLGSLLAPAVVNMVNFMDGIDGITCLTMAVWGAAAWVVGAQGDDVPLTVLGVLVVGSSLGFLPWNLPIARLFLGDVGSYLFGGLVVAGLLLVWAHRGPIAPLLAPLAIYAVDTASTLARRAARGERVLDAHREHIYQRLVAGGFPHRLVAAGAAGLSVAATVSWLLITPWGAAVVTAGAAALYFASPRLLLPALPSHVRMPSEGSS